MPRNNASSDVDFLTWFESLATELQRDALRAMLIAKKESSVVVFTTELFTDAAFYFPPGFNPMLLLN